MSIPVKRRDFFKYVGAILALSSCQNSAMVALFGESVPEKEFIYTGYRVGKDPYDDSESGLYINGETLKKKIPLKNEIHSIEYSKALDLKVFIPKLGYFTYYQIGDGPVVSLEAESGHYFYGHGIIDEKRKLLYLTKAPVTKSRVEFDRRNEPGFVYVYSIPDFKLVDKFDSFGNDPHDIMISQDRLVVCNGGSKSNIAFIDLNSRKLIKNYFCDVDHITLRHIEEIDPENFVIGPLSWDPNKSTPPLVLNLKTGFKVFDGTYTADMGMLRKQLLSVLYHDGHIYATCPETDALLVWDLSGKFIGGVSIYAASLLVYSKRLKGVIAGSGKFSEPARLVNVKDGQLVFDKIAWGQDMIGSHATIVEA